MRPLRVAVCGFGYWGPNYARVVAESPNAKLVWVADPSQARMDAAVARFGVPAYDRPWWSQCDAVMIATPVATHYALARRALEEGKHVVVAKPLAATVEQAEELVELAEANGLVLLVDHTFLYTGAVRRIKDLHDNGELGGLLYVDSVRANLGLFQHDADVLWDLAPHDVSILDYLTGKTPVAVSAVGADRAGSGHVDVAYLSLFYADGLIAHVHVNWLSPVKVRRVLIGGTRRMVVYDDTEPSEKVKVYSSGVDVDPVAALVDYRVGDCWSPKLDITEALAVEFDHFAGCVRDGRRPVTDGMSGVRVVRVLEAASRSLAAEGVRVAV